MRKDITPNEYRLIETVARTTTASQPDLYEDILQELFCWILDEAFTEPLKKQPHDPWEAPAMSKPQNIWIKWVEYREQEAPGKQKRMLTQRAGKIILDRREAYQLQHEHLPTEQVSRFIKKETKNPDSELTAYILTKPHATALMEYFKSETPSLRVIAEKHNTNKSTLERAVNSIKRKANNLLQHDHSFSYSVPQWQSAELAQISNLFAEG